MSTTEAPTISELLRDSYEERFTIAMQVAGLLAEGATDHDTAVALGLDREEIAQARADLQPVAARLKTLTER